MNWKKFSGIANMRTDILSALFLSLVTIIVVGCASSSAPRRWLPSAKESQADQYGAWIEIQLETVEQPDGLEGEFIAVSRDSVFVADNNGLHPVAQSKIQKARITAYDSDHGALGLWATVGSLSTISHGFYLIGTFPLWVITGTAATAARSREGKDWVGTHWDQYRKYARYPTGLPGNIDRSRIKARKVDEWENQIQIQTNRRRDRRRR